MDEILNFFRDNKDAVTAVGIILTFIVSAASLYFSVRNNRAVHYVNAVTKNRVEWMYKLRDLCTEYIAASSIDCNYFVSVINEDKDTEKIGEQLSHVRKLCSQIKLMLNFTDEIDKEIIKIVEGLKERYENYYVKYGVLHPDKLKEDDKQNAERMADETREDLQKLDKFLQIYLKAEWNRVKYESQGKIYEKETQEFDIWELEQKYDNPDYKNDVLKRFYINSKAKIKRILRTSKFLIFVLCIVIIILVIYIPKIMQIVKELMYYISLYR